MFNVGDMVLYPLYGVGTIIELKEMEILGSIGKYYVLKVSATGMSVMVPVESDKSVGLRSIIGRDAALSVIENFPRLQSDSCPNWNKRYRENMDLLKTGNVLDSAKVVKSLMDRERERGLSTGERRMYVQAKQILLSELEVATEISATELEKQLYNSLSVS